jgi:hypothetical protein
MKKIFLSAILAALVCIAGMGTATAQDDGFKIIPVEMYACTYNDGKGARDLDRWVDKWTKWADDRGMDNYAAWTLTPYYFGPGENAGIDVIWMGAGTDAVALGQTQEDWLANNGGLANEIAEIVTCGSHGNFASVNFKLPPQAATPSNAVLTFSDCTYKDAAGGGAVNAAMAQWSEYMADNGSEAGIWHWYPAYGGGAEKFDFKWLEAHEDLAALGADYEAFGNGGGFVTYNRLLGHLVDCDSARAYRAQSRRFVQLR